MKSATLNSYFEDDNAKKMLFFFFRLHFCEPDTHSSLTFAETKSAHVVT